MITFGGIIGAGLFVGPSIAISAIGPAVVSYAIARFLVLVVGWLYWYFWVIVTAVFAIAYAVHSRSTARNTPHRAA